MGYKIRAWVTWAPGTDEDKKPVTWRYSWFTRLCCRVLRADAFTLGRTTRTKVLDAILHPERHAGFYRHEAYHRFQQRGTLLLWWLCKYIFSLKFRRQVENEAAAREYADYPRFRY